MDLEVRVNDMAGINKTLDNYYNNKLEPLLTKQEVMEHLHIKDEHTFYKLINNEGLPNKKIGNKILIPLNQYQKWLNKY